jgi:MoxR-like ATPase
VTDTMSSPAWTPVATGRRAQEVLDEVERAVVGKRPALELVLLGILSGGHVLLEDLPGLGKTLMARSFAQVLGLQMRRIQFTPDLLPSDVTGAPVLDPRTGELTFRAGPVFANLLLADEINRTPPRTQAALLEAMAERQVTVDGVTHPLPEPFTVLATDNPIEFEGTYPLPEAQLDRFTMRIRIGYLTPPDEALMLRRRIDRKAPEASLRSIGEATDLLAMTRSLEDVEVDDDLLDYVVRIQTATREHPHIVVGASPRGGLAMLALARGRAVLAGRAFVTPDDVKQVAVPALGHRLVLRPELWVRRVSGDDVVTEVIESVGTPPTKPSLSGTDSS